VEHERGARVVAELTALAALEVGEEAEPALVDAAEQHRARRRLGVSGRSGHDHRVGLEGAVRDGVVEPALEHDERVGVGVGLVQCALPGNHQSSVGSQPVAAYDAAMRVHQVSVQVVVDEAARAG
jgi:hypothetical protein